MPPKMKSKAKIADPGPTLTTGKNGAIYLNGTAASNYISLGTYDEDDQFDPVRISWAELFTLYQDDPLLAAIFERMLEWSNGSRSRGTFNGWTLNRPGVVSSSTSNVNLANSFTVSYDSSGTATITEDK